MDLDIPGLLVGNSLGYCSGKYTATAIGMLAVLNPLFMGIHLVYSPESSAVMTEYHYTSNFKIIADLHPERVRPLIKRLESVSLARLPSGLVSRPPESIPPGKQHTIMLTVQVREAHFLICSGDITTTQLPNKDMIETARRKAPLPGLAIYGKIEPAYV